MKKEPIKMVCLPAEDSIINIEFLVDDGNCFPILNYHIKEACRAMSEAACRALKNKQDPHWMYMSPLGRLFEKYKEEVKNGKS